MLAQKQSDRSIVGLVERLTALGYDMCPNGSRRGRSGIDHTFDYLVVRQDGFTNLLAAVEIITDAEDPETSLHQLFAFQDKCSACGISRPVLIAIPRLSFVASQFAQKDGVEVFDEQALQMFLSRAPAARVSPDEVPSTYTQKSQVLQALKTLGYRVDEAVKVTGRSGAAHVFTIMALSDDGFLLVRLGVDCLSGEEIDQADISAFDEKCRDAGITERTLLVPGGVTAEAGKLARERGIQVIRLDGRPREAVPGASLDLAAALSQKPGTNEDGPGSPGVPKLPEAAAMPPTPPAAASDVEAGPAAPDTAPEHKKTVVVSELKTATEPGPASETTPYADGAGPATSPAPPPAMPASAPVFAPLEPPPRSRPFSMRSVIDQFLGPQIRLKPAEKSPGPPAAAAAEATAAVPQNGPAESLPLEDRAAPNAERPAEAGPPGGMPGRPFLAKAVLAFPGGPQDPEAAAGGEAPDRASDETAGTPAPAEAPKTAAAGASEALTAATARIVDAFNKGPAEGPAASGESQNDRPAAPGKGGQADPPSGAGRMPFTPKSPAARDRKQGVVGTPASVAANAQFLKPSLDKTDPDRRQGLAARVRPPERPGEGPKPVVVEEVVEKPKVKLSKAARPEALQAITESTARRFMVLPISVTDNVLEVAMVNPADLATIQVLEMASKMRVRAVAAEQKEILDAIDFNYKAFGQIAEQIAHIETASDASAGVDLVASTANAPVAAALNLIVEEAVKARASDIHIEPEEKRLRVRYRVDGVLQEVMSLPVKIHPPLTSRVKVMADLNIADRLRPQDGQFSLEVKGKGVDVRVATSPTVHGETVVMRILDKSMAVMELPQLGFTDECLAKYMKMLAIPFGMICVSGPTGAGKTTTLYASLNTMDRVTRNIITAEDPVEYRFEGIKQIQVNPKAGLTFASVLRSMMRLDPDVILVGEIRDAETASIAVKAALTGHTVLCSIHANDAVSVVYRLLDLGVEPFMVASVITGTIAQRMARRVCTNCAAQTKPTEVEAAAYESVMEEKLESYLSGSGCDLCNYSGYKGRLGLYEVLAMTDTTRAMVLKGATTSELRTQAIKDGMVTLFKDGMEKVKAGKTTASEVMRNAYSIE